MIAKKHLAILTAAAFYSSGNPALAKEFRTNNEKPNFLVIMVDDHGYGDLSVTGGTDIQTPNLDNLFAKGVKMTSFYSNCTVCSPTRASLLTGMYPDMAGVPGVIRTDEANSWGYLRTDKTTLPERLKENGYQTAIIGKWHLGLESPNTPNERGFDFFHGFLGDMMDDYWTHLRHGNNYMRLNSAEIKPQGHATELFSDFAIDYLEKASRSEHPFFLFLSYNAPHFPIQPPQEWLDRVKKREPHLPLIRANNIAFVEHMDYSIGKVLASLETLGLAKNTVIIYTSDNGGSLPHGASNGNLREGKQDMYEGGIKVPTCFVWPGKIESGTRSDKLALTMDIYPTLVEIAGGKIPDDIDGISILPALLGQKQVTDDRVVYFVRREGGIYGGLAYYAARRGRYKLLQNSPYEPLQIFDIWSDPYEKTPLSTNSAIFQELKFSLSQHIRRSGSVPWQSE